MEVYLDNAATTKPRKSVVQAVVYGMEELYGNPSSLHGKGVMVEKHIKQIRKNIARFLGCQDQTLYFTSGGTESNNMAIRGAAEAYGRRGRHLITSKIEHPSVLNTMEDLAAKGYEVTYIDVDKRGLIDLDQLLSAVREDTILVSIMHVNNEVGSIQPIEILGRELKRKNKNTLFHVDAIQSFGKIKIPVNTLPIDMLSFSGHKIHGPKGIGGLYVKKGVRLRPVVTGGNQETGIRSGTENVPGIFGLGKAVEEMDQDHPAKMKRLKDLKEYLIKNLSTAIENIEILTGADQSFADHILSVAFIGVKSEVLLHSLEEDGIYVSAGSACSSKKKGQSHVLKAMGLREQLIDSTLRLSISDETTIEQLSYAIDRIKYHVEALRKIMR
ncbi:cysteine desulfurase family protein [Alkaliphilus crotonatoxidans]